MLRCRLIMVGDSTVGKTSIVNQFVELALPKTYQMTQGVDYKVKELKVEDTDYTVEFHIIDLCGNPIYEDFISPLVSFM